MVLIVLCPETPFQVNFGCCWAAHSFGYTTLIFLFIICGRLNSKSLAANWDSLSITWPAPRGQTHNNMVSIIQPGSSLLLETFLGWKLIKHFMLTLLFSTPYFFWYTSKLCYLVFPCFIFADRKVKIWLTGEARLFFAWWSCFVSVKLLSPTKSMILLLFVASVNLFGSQLRQNAIMQSRKK